MAQDYIRADVLEESVLKEIEKLSARKDIITEIVTEFEEHNRNTVLPELEEEKQAVETELAGIREEKEKLSRWLMGTDPTAHAVSYLNSQVDTLAERELETQERLWNIEDRLNTLRINTYNGGWICEKLREFVQVFPELQTGERKLLVDALIKKVQITEKAATVSLKPPLSGFGFCSTSIAPRGVEPLFEE